MILGLLTVVLFLSTSTANAQVASGSLNGTVYDATGAVIPNAKVELRSQGSGAIRETVSNSSGYFYFAAIQPGTYDVTVSAAGFTSWRQEGVAFSQGDNRTLPNISLKVGGTAEQVTVVAAGDAIAPVETGENSQTLNTYMITELSIQGRNAGELLKIMPGVAMTNGLGNMSSFNSLVTGTNSGPVGAFSVNGTQPNGGMSMTIEGANVVDPGNQGTQIMNINQDHTQEVKILTAAFGAEYAKGPTTFQAYGKSGTAQLHGGAYLYARHGKFNAIDSLQRAQGVGSPGGRAKPIDEYYYPGFTLGGPVVIPGLNFNRDRDKLFFWTGYEYMKQQPVGQLRNHVVPTAEMLQGNFSPEHLATFGPDLASRFPNSARVPCTTNEVSCGDLGLVNGRIPASALDPNMLAIAKLFPAPNIDPRTNGGYNYQYFDNPPRNRWEWKTRIDWNISNNTKLYGQFTRQDETNRTARALWWAPDNALPYPSPLIAATRSDNFSANLTHVFTPTLTNEVVVAYVKYINPAQLEDFDRVDPAKVGYNVQGLFGTQARQVPFLFSNQGQGFPGMFSQAVWGGNFPGGAFGGIKKAPSIADNLSKVAGTHSLKFGFYWDFSGNLQSGGNNINGRYDFDMPAQFTTGNVIADLLMGRAFTYEEASREIVNDVRYNQYSFYAQDQWKATRRLTLTLGMRLDHLGQWYLKGDDVPGLVVFDPSLYNNGDNPSRLTGLTWNAINKDIPKSGWKSPLFYFNPRFGLAYDLSGNGNTVIRGGIGKYRYQVSNNDIGGAINAPYGIITTRTNPLSSPSQIAAQRPTGTPNGLGGSITALQLGDDRTPNTINYNFIISQRMPWRSVVEFVYTGSQSEDLLITGNGNASLGNINRIPVGAFFQTNPVTGVRLTPAEVSSAGIPNVNQYRPMRHYQGVGVVTHGSYSNYNAFQVLFQKQAGAVHITSNYTFGKAMGIRDGQTNNGAGGGAIIDPFNIDNNYGVLAYDRTHIFNAAYIWNLPSPIKGNKLLGGVVNGWELSGITQFQSGADIQSNTGGNMNVQWPNDPDGTGPGLAVNQNVNLGTNAITLIPKLTCDPRQNLREGQYFNPACFTTPAQGSNGDVIWPYMKGPAYWTSDLALYKNFRMGESQNIQFRFSAFNFLNHPLPQFNANGNQDIRLVFSQAGGTNTNSATTGTPQYTVGRRVVEFTLKYNF